MRILLLTQWFEPEPAIKGLAFARALQDRGHDVEVLTGFPNYPDGRLYPGYRLRLWQREVMEGISIVRVPLYPSHDRSALRRIANYVSFAVSAAVLGPWITRRPDVVYAYHPPGTIALPAMVLRLSKGAPFVLDIADLWPDSLEGVGMIDSPALIKMVGAWCRLSYRAAAAVVATSPGLVPRLIERGATAAKTTLIYNWCDERQLGSIAPDSAVRRSLGFDGRFVVLFAGNMGSAQALDTVLDAAALARSRVPEAQFVLIGGGVDAARLTDQAKARGLTNVRFLPRRPFSEIGEVLAQADVLLVHLRDQPLFRITTPSKIQAYLHMGKPILAAVRGDAADLVIRAGAGLVCDPESPERLCEAVAAFSRMPREALRAMGERGREFYRRELSIAAGTERFDALFSRVTGREAFDEARH